MKVAELGIYLGQWMEQVQHGQNVPMKYETLTVKRSFLAYSMKRIITNGMFLPAGKNLNFKSVSLLKH